MSLRPVEIQGRRSLTEFLSLPEVIYRGDNAWVPPMRLELKQKLGTLRRGIFHFQGGRARLIGISDSGRMVARLAVILRSDPDMQSTNRLGYFGLFESIDDQAVVDHLFSVAGDQLQEWGCDQMMGPITLTTNDESGILVSGYGTHPMVMCNYAPPYYGRLLESAGLSKAIDLLSYGAEVSHHFPRKYGRIVNRASSDPSISIRPFLKRSAARDIELIRRLYNECFRNIYGFMPLSGAEAQAMGRQILSFSDERLVWLATCNNEPAGCIIAVRDLNEILRRLHGRMTPVAIARILFRKRSISGVRVMVLCVLPKFRRRGVEVFLIEAVRRRMVEAGYTHAEFSVVMENNIRMRKVLEALGFPLLKRYRLYERYLPQRSKPGIGERISERVAP